MLTLIGNAFKAFVIFRCIQLHNNLFNVQTVLGMSEVRSFAASNAFLYRIVSQKHKLVNLFAYDGAAFKAEALHRRPRCGKAHRR